MSRVQNELKREIEEGLDELLNLREGKKTQRFPDWDWEEEQHRLLLEDDDNCGFEGWEDDDEEDDDWEDDEDDWEDDDEEDDDWEDEDEQDRLFGKRSYPVEDVRRARELLWGTASGA